MVVMVMMVMMVIPEHTSFLVATKQMNRTMRFQTGFLVFTWGSYV